MAIKLPELIGDDRSALSWGAILVAVGLGAGVASIPEAVSADGLVAVTLQMSRLALATGVVALGCVLLVRRRAGWQHMANAVRTSVRGKLMYGALLVYIAIVGGLSALSSAAWPARVLFAGFAIAFMWKGFSCLAAARLQRCQSRKDSTRDPAAEQAS